MIHWKAPDLLQYGLDCFKAANLSAFNFLFFCVCVCVVKIYYSYYLVVEVVNGFDMSSHITVLYSFCPQSKYATVGL